MSEAARQKITGDLTATGIGRKTIKYRLRDWSVSRQRYWGAPIPIIYCDHCGVVPVPEKDLPVRLPYNVEFHPNGQSPLSTCSEFTDTVCPVCRKPAKRETDTLDTFVCSSWYYLRFFDSNNVDMPFDRERAKQIMPVDKYVGGIEHASMHLLYARFITKALRDMNYLNFNEPLCIREQY
jgi:leucyl-tRNA synthetase